MTCEWAKAGPKDICLSVDVRNAGPDEVAVHVLPTVWFRNTWSWDAAPPPRPRWWADGWADPWVPREGRRDDRHQRGDRVG